MRLEDIAEQFLKMVSSELDPYTSQKGTIVKGTNVVTLFTPAHIQFAKYGRGPGKQPPLDSIIEWVKKKGIISGNDTAEGTAWAIAKSIAQKGTLNYTPNAPNAMDEAITKYVDEYLAAVSTTYSKTISESMKVMKILPDEVTLYKI